MLAVKKETFAPECFFFLFFLQPARVVASFTKSCYSNYGLFNKGSVEDEFLNLY